MKKTLIVKLSEITYKKLLKKKEEVFPQGADWEEFFNYLVKDVHLEELSGERISKSTRENLFKMWVRNFSENLQYIKEGKTLADLVPEKPEEAPKGAAIVIGAGPSLWKHKHLELLANSDFDGVLCVTDRMVIPCLKAGCIPDKYEMWIACGVDGAPIIKKWWDDPIVEKYGSEIKACIITSTHPEVVKVLRNNGVDIYWFNPIFDDWRDNESYTRLQLIMTQSERNPKGAASLSCLGNSGSACWVLAHALLRRSPIALIGIDFGYPGEQPIEKTQYFSTFVQAAGGNVELAGQAFKRFYNPFFKCEAYADPVFLHYREAFLEALKQTEPWVLTIQCTEGGVLFDLEGRMKHMRFKDFLKYYKDVEELKKHFLKAD